MVKYGLEESTFGLPFRAKFHPDRCNMSPLEKHQNRAVSNWNAGVYGSRILPVLVTKQSVFASAWANVVVLL